MEFLNLGIQNRTLSFQSSNKDFLGDHSIQVKVTLKFFPTPPVKEFITTFSAKLEVCRVNSIKETFRVPPIKFVLGVDHTPLVIKLPEFI